MDYSVSQAENIENDKISKQELFYPCFIDDASYSSRLRVNKRRASSFFKIMSIISFVLIGKTLIVMLENDFQMLEGSMYSYLSACGLIIPLISIFYIFIRAMIDFKSMHKTFVIELILSIASIISLEMYSIFVYSAGIFQIALKTISDFSVKIDYLMQMPIELLVLEITYLCFFVFIIYFKVKTKS